jgi:hypothetical protein
MAGSAACHRVGPNPRKRAEGLGKPGAVYRVEARDAVRIKIGAASADIKESGDITIVAKDYDVKASGRASVKASGDVTIMGRKIANNRGQLLGQPTASPLPHRPAHIRDEALAPDLACDIPAWFTAGS